MHVTTNKGVLTIDLAAIAHNWKVISYSLGENTSCGAVVKANAYGLGALPVASSLYDAGCRQFFVANVSEAIALRSSLGVLPTIYVLLGFADGEESLCLAHDLVPILTSLVMFERWLAFAKAHDGASAESGFRNIRAGIKVNTGMNRLGVDSSELYSLMSSRPECLAAAGVELVMSHFACADEVPHPLNQQQLTLFTQLVSVWRSSQVLPNVKFSMANSAGVLLHEKSHFDLVRPGIALYGGGTGGEPCELAEKLHDVVCLNLPVMQIRQVAAGESVGYGATFCGTSERTIAIVAGGYADGIFRVLSNKMWGYINGVHVPLVGRVSMDSCMFDVTDANISSNTDESLSVEILGSNASVHALAKAANTISYEVLTSLGSRYERHYI